MATIHNPIIRGFNPDPCLLRVSEDYYIATSTFEWFPGIALYHSKDLANWKLIGHALTRESQLNLLGIASSEGVWAPDLTYCVTDRVFYLSYSVMKNWTYDGPRDIHNYVVTSPTIEGPWSDPVYIDSGGIDPSLFFHPDGRTFYLRNRWDYRAGRDHFAGITIQEFDRKTMELIGDRRLIFNGVGLGKVEGARIYYHNEYYYLMTAEGGTFYEHAVTLSRSRDIWGPYEAHPNKVVLTSAYNPENPLQKAGHASLIQDHHGFWYIAYLVGRPLPHIKRCPLGREAAIQKVEWGEDGWLYLEGGDVQPEQVVNAPHHKEHRWEKRPVRDDFDQQHLDPHYQSLRAKIPPHFCNTTERPGYLRLRGRESITSPFEQTLVAIRQSSFSYIATTALECEPKTYNQMAGIVAFYDEGHFFYLAVTNEDGHSVVNLYLADRGFWIQPIDPIQLPDTRRIYLKMQMIMGFLQCFYSVDETNWYKLGDVFDASILSDEYLIPVHFTGSFVALAAQDLDGSAFVADFDYLTYDEIEDEP